LFSSIRSKLWIAVASVLVLAAGVLTLPAPAPSGVGAPEERAAPLLEAEVERRQQLRIFEEIQQLGPRLARHSVTIPGTPQTAALPSDLTPPTPRIDPSGHGLIISADGEILTASAAVRGREVLPVELIDGRRIDARVVAFDPDADLVLLQSPDVPRTDAAPWATTPPTAGMLSVAVSHAAGQVAVAPVFVMAAPDADRRVRTTNADLSPGTPLFTTAGEVFAIAAGNGDTSAAIIASAVARLRERVASGQARRGALGLTFQPIDGALRAAFPTAGVLIADVAPYGAADEAGLRAGDVLTAMGDTEVTTPDVAQQAIAALQPGSRVDVHVIRARQTMTVPVTMSSALGLRVRQTPGGAWRDTVGEAPAAFTVFDEATRAIADVLPQSRIISINGERVRTSEEAREAFGRARRSPIVLYLEDERGRFFRAVERPE
jgi:S1-C subfamily serine protease